MRSALSVVFALLYLLVVGILLLGVDTLLSNRLAKT